MIKVLFVCMGNICRSPTAQGVFEKHVEDAGLTAAIQADSAGTLAYHIGKPPDRRARASAERRGYRLEGQQARRVAPEDFETFDYIVAMDYDNLGGLRELAPPGTDARVRLLMAFAEESDYAEVPDPYYGGGQGFERVLDLVEAASRGLLAHIRRRYNL